MSMIVGVVFIISLSLSQSQSLLDLDEGDTCRTATEGPWVCRALKKCSHVDVRVSRPPICSFNGRDPIICCPPAAKKISLAEQMCAVQRKSTSCANVPFEATNLRSKRDKIFRTTVVGGTAAPSKKNSYMVLIGYGAANDISWRCGGSLISDVWILTAAHCTDGGSDVGKARWARLGELDYATNADDARIQNRRIVQHINHPGYKPPIVYNDIALHKLDSPVTFDQYVAPICLQTTFDIPQLKATVVGWGRTEFDVSSKLLQADITLVNHTECFKLYGTDSSVPKGVNRRAMLCAGEKEGGKDACKVLVKVASRKTSRDKRNEEEKNDYKRFCYTEEDLPICAARFYRDLTQCQRLGAIGPKVRVAVVCQPKSRASQSTVGHISPVPSDQLPAGPAFQGSFHVVALGLTPPPTPAKPIQTPALERLEVMYPGALFSRASSRKQYSSKYRQPVGRPSRITSQAIPLLIPQTVWTGRCCGRPPMIGDHPQVPSTAIPRTGWIHPQRRDRSEFRKTSST
ncbi:unnamed protein product [Nesidiocoris tenuis]|uniref:Peptidase S1 domain-containing protein n=1 Tax=Nesidiocoris tenuis TaxID=355587 RepID=A0A6H5GLA8_9HEMI|nr:unnamed protein product [Nesidiocoris tenuis]